MGRFDYATKINDGRAGWRITRTGQRAHYVETNQTRALCGASMAESWHADTYWQQCQRCVAIQLRD